MLKEDPQNGGRVEDDGGRDKGLEVFHFVVFALSGKALALSMSVGRLRRYLV